MGNPGEEARTGVAWALGRLGAGEAWELDGFRTVAEREAYQALVAEVAEARGIAVTLHGHDRRLRVVRA